MGAVVVESPEEADVAIVTHGTVMALYVSRWSGTDAVAFWRELERPSFAVLALPGRELVRAVGHVE